MKRLFLTLFVIIITQYSNATIVFRTDTTKVEYQVCGNDTIYLKKHSTYRERTYCGLKQYEGNLFAKFHKQFNRIFIYILHILFPFPVYCGITRGRIIRFRFLGAKFYELYFSGNSCVEFYGE